MKTYHVTFSAPRGQTPTSVTYTVAAHDPVSARMTARRIADVELIGAWRIVRVVTVQEAA